MIESGASMAIARKTPVAFEAAISTKPTLLAAVEQVLRDAGCSLHSRQIASTIADRQLATLSGKTPWKTVTARVSMDIRKRGAESTFMRTAHGLFALREWEFATEFEVKRRRIAPIDEVIRAVPKSRFEQLKAEFPQNTLYAIPYERAVLASIEIPRRDAEETDEFVQLIPTFVVRNANQIWTYVRTKRLPEARLHHTRCISFGGHMQADDDMPLFVQDMEYRHAILRELHEELAFSSPPRISYLGALHLCDSVFERQHAGLVFDVMVSKGTKIGSLEPGMHTDVRPTRIDDLEKIKSSLDSWSQALLQVVNAELI